MTTKLADHVWSSDALFSKAVLYLGEMEHYTTTDWQFAVWSSLALELLARAALAHVSPTLLADKKDWRNTHFALGHPLMAKKFSPKSVAISEVLSMLKELLPDFPDEHSDFCAKHCALRNAELHSGEDAFAALDNTAWLPKFYASCDVFLRSMHKGLDDFFSDPQSAQEMIAALKDTAAKAVGKDIEAHKQIWNDKSPDEQRVAQEQAVVWATRHSGHRVTCPACGSAALLRGSGHGPVATEVGEDEVVQRQTMIPSSFECVACGLKISGLSRLTAAGLGNSFTSKTTSSAAEFFNLHTEEELDEARARSAEPQFEEDFNEY